MNCKTFKYSDHAIIQMFKRNLGTWEVEQSVNTGQVIKEYRKDRPYPSYLILGDINGKIIHVVVAVNSVAKECVIITAYIPDPGVWGNEFKTKL